MCFKTHLQISHMGMQHSGENPRHCTRRSLFSCCQPTILCGTEDHPGGFDIWIPEMLNALLELEPSHVSVPDPFHPWILLETITPCETTPHFLASISGSRVVFFIADLAMDQYPYIPFLGDEHPFASYFDVHQGDRVLTHPQILSTSSSSSIILRTKKGASSSEASGYSPSSSSPASSAGCTRAASGARKASCRAKESGARTFLACLRMGCLIP